MVIDQYETIKKLRAVQQKFMDEFHDIAAQRTAADLHGANELGHKMALAMARYRGAEAIIEELWTIVLTQAKEPV